MNVRLLGMLGVTDKVIAQGKYLELEFFRTILMQMVVLYRVFFIHDDRLPTKVVLILSVLLLSVSTKRVSELLGIQNLLTPLAARYCK